MSTFAHCFEIKSWFRRVCKVMRFSTLFGLILIIFLTRKIYHNFLFMCNKYKEEEAEWPGVPLYVGLDVIPYQPDPQFDWL